MKQLKKTLLTLALLITAATGAWADGVTMKEITSSDIQSSWNGNTDPVKATDLPGFKAMTHDEAVALGAPSNNELVYLIYAINANNKFAALIYMFGTKYSSETEFTLDALQSNVQNYWVYYTYSDAPAASGPEVAWDKDKKSGSFTMPGGNVTLEPEYYPQAALAAAPTAINDVPATTDGAIVNAGTVENIGETTTAQGTVMYYVSPSALDDAALLALDADQWTAEVPTAQSLSEGPAYVYYYVRGNDGDTDETTFSDGDILATNALTVTIAAEPTYAVTFADDLTEPDEWTADPKANVTKGKTVTVTYTGTKKVIGVKAEKKEAPAETTVTLTTGEIGDLTSWGSNSKTINGITIAVSGDAHFFVTGYMEVSAYDPETADPIPSTGTYTFTSSVGKIKRIDINHESGKWWGSGDGWPGSYNVSHSSTFTWSGTPAASVTLNGSCNEEDQCAFDVTSFVFTIEPTN